MSIKELLVNKKWEKIKYFYQSQDITEIEQLKERPLDELYFVPGIDYTLIEELEVMIHQPEFPERTSIELTNTSSGSDLNEAINQEVVLDTTPMLSHEISENNIDDSSAEDIPVNIDKWYLNYPWEMLLDTYKVKKKLTDILNERGIQTVQDLENNYPFELKSRESGISESVIMEFNEYMGRKLRELGNTKSFKHIKDVVSSLSWEHYYSKINLAEFSQNLPSAVLDMDIITIFQLANLSTEKRIKNRLENETLREFLTIRTDYDLPSVNKSILYSTYDLLFDYLMNLITPGDENRTLKLQISIPEVIAGMNSTEVAVLLSEDSVQTFDKLISKYNINTMNDLHHIEFQISDYFEMQSFLPIISKDYKKDLIKIIDCFTDFEKNILFSRIKGETLQIIADRVCLTRQRIRQIEQKLVSKIIVSSEDAVTVLKKNNTYFTSKLLVDHFDDDKYSMIIGWVLRQHSDKFAYFHFADMFIQTEILGDNFTREFNAIISVVSDDVGDVTKLYFDALPELRKAGFTFVSESNFSSFLSGILNYKVMNGTYIKFGSESPNILATIIENEFDFDIKLDDKDDNEELASLRTIVQRLYPQIRLPKTNRALTAIITRSKKVILCGRGRYTAISKIYFPDYLRNQIFQWIINQNSSLTYSEVFERFKTRLQLESNIDNGHFLHGALMYYYPEEFHFKRDVFAKVGDSIVRTDERVISLLENNGMMSISEIADAIPGIQEYQLLSIVERNNILFRSDKKRIGIISNVNIDKNEAEGFKSILDQLIDDNDSYLSASFLYNSLLWSSLGDVLRKSELSERGLFQYLSNILSDLYVFKHPHIVRKSGFLDIRPINQRTLLRRLFVEGKGIISREALGKFREKYQWSEMSIYGFLHEGRENLVHVSSDEYVTLEKSGVTDEILSAIDTYFDKIDFLYYPLKDFCEFEVLPKTAYDWNHFMLEDIIEKFSNRYKLIDREHNGVNFVSSIIVPRNTEFENFEDIVIFELSSNTKSSYTESELRNLLSSRGLIAQVIPQELFQGEKISFNIRSELFDIKQ